MLEHKAIKAKISTFLDGKWNNRPLYKDLFLLQKNMKLKTNSRRMETTTSFPKKLILDFDAKIKLI